jgi:hypothetical protein
MGRLLYVPSYEWVCIHTAIPAGFSGDGVVLFWRRLGIANHQAIVFDHAQVLPRYWNQ